MEIKKSPKADLERGKTLGLLMGAVVALAVLFVGFEWGDREMEVIKYEGVADIIAEEEIEITRPEDTPPPPPPPEVPPAAEVLLVVDDDVELEHQEFLSSEDDQSSAQVEAFVPPAVVEEEESADEIFTVVEESPEFPGGEGEMLKYINKTVKYPIIAQENGIQGRVVCSFVVNTDGTIVDAQVLRGIDPSLDREALRVISTMPKWKPGKQRGKPVRVRFTLPIQFRLN